MRPSLDRADAGERELLNALVGVAEVGVVGLREDHLGAVAHRLVHDLIVDDVEADGDAGDHRSPVRPDIHDHVGRARLVAALDEVDELGRELAPERPVRHVLAERDGVPLVVEVDHPLPRVPQDRRVEVVPVARGDGSGDERSSGPLRHRVPDRGGGLVAQRIDVGCALRPEHDVDVLVVDRLGRQVLVEQVLAERALIEVAGSRVALHGPDPQACPR